MESRTANEQKAAIKRIGQPQNAYILLPFFQNLLLNEIIKYLSIKDQVKLSHVCYGLYMTFKPNLDKRAFKQLLQSVVDDERDMVKRILDKKPLLLLGDPEKTLVIESQKTWQIFQAEKPLKMALKRGQFEMVKLMLPYFEELEKRSLIKDGKAEALAQWKVRELSEQEKEQYVLKMKKLIEGIAKESFPNGTEKDRPIDRISEETKALLSAFRKELLPDVAITLDNYVDVEQLLIVGYQAYVDHFNVFQNWNQRDLYCICVLGFSQGVLTPELGKVFCEGLYYVVEENKPISARAAALKLADNETSFYRSSRDSVSGEGFDHVISGQGTACVVANGRGTAGVQARFWINYVEQKQTSLANLTTSLSQGIGRDMSAKKNGLV